MQPHPFNQSALQRVIGIAIALLAVAILWSLLILYSDASLLSIGIDSFLYGLLMVACGYGYWYIAPFLPVFQAKVAVAVFVQFFCLGTVAGVLFLSGIEPSEVIVHQIPIHLFHGFSFWIILLQWYDGVHKTVQPEKQEPLPITTLQNEVIGHISTKKGNEIHILPVDELLYIQAYGDYVILFANEGKYLKEQTMKHFEQHLPASFVRIHRSFIVNINQIIRVELFEKENYNIRLKNGVCLRASQTGYKLLKERMGL